MPAKVSLACLVSTAVGAAVRSGGSSGEVGFV